MREARHARARRCGVSQSAGRHLARDVDSGRFTATTCSLAADDLLSLSTDSHGAAVGRVVETDRRFSAHFCHHKSAHLDVHREHRTDGQPWLPNANSPPHPHRRPLEGSDSYPVEASDDAITRGCSDEGIELLEPEVVERGEDECTVWDEERHDVTDAGPAFDGSTALNVDAHQRTRGVAPVERSRAAFAHHRRCVRGDFQRWNTCTLRATAANEDDQEREPTRTHQTPASWFQGGRSCQRNRDAELRQPQGSEPVLSITVAFLRAEPYSTGRLPVEPSDSATLRARSDGQRTHADRGWLDLEHPRRTREARPYATCAVTSRGSIWP